MIKRIKNLVRNLNYLTKHSLWDQREEDIVFLSDKILDDAVFQFGIETDNWKKPFIYDTDESLDIIINSGKSFIRTSDGEIKIILGISQPFQKYEKEIADGLIEVLSNSDENLIVAINRYYFVPNFERFYSKYYQRNAFDFRSVYRKYLNPNVQYIDSCVTGWNLEEKIDEKSIVRMEKWYHSFEGKDLVIVVGKGVLEKYEYDIFALAKSKQFIFGPKRNGWDSHEYIVSQIESDISKDKLIVFIFGMAGKVMNYELTKKGYVCWDVGHLPKYWNVYKSSKKMSRKDIDKFYAPD